MQKASSIHAYFNYIVLHGFSSVLSTLPLSKILSTPHRLIIALFDWGRKWPPLEMVIYTSNFTAQTTMYGDFYNCLVF